MAPKKQAEQNGFTKVQDDPECLAFAFIKAVHKNGKTFSVLSPLYKGQAAGKLTLSEINQMVTSNQAISFVHTNEKGNGLVKILVSANTGGPRSVQVPF